MPRGRKSKCPIVFHDHLLKCSICGFEAKCKRGIELHMRLRHNSGKVFLEGHIVYDQRVNETFTVDL